MPTASCSNCGRSYRVPEEAAGKKFKCKQCGGVIRVPGVPAAVGVASQKPVVVAAKPHKVATPPLVPMAAASVDSADADLDALASLETGGVVDNSIPLIATQPAVIATRATSNAKSKPVGSSQRFALGFRPSRLSIALIVGGVLLGLWGGKEMILASSASETPQEITCADLSANGPGSNAHVRVTDFRSMVHFVWHKTHTTDADWETVWLPIVPPGAIKNPPGKRLKPNTKVIPINFVDSSQIHVLIKSHTVHTHADVDPAMRRDSVEGLVINKIEKLSDIDRELLKDAYPLMDVDNVYIVEDGRQPAGGTGMLGLAGGAVLILSGLFLMFRPIS